MMIEFSHNNFLHAQVERSIQYVLGLEPIELLQPSTQSTVTDSCSDTETRNESEQPTSPTHPLLSHVMDTVFSPSISTFSTLPIFQTNCFFFMFHLIHVANERSLYRPAYHGCLGT